MHILNKPTRSLLLAASALLAVCSASAQVADLVTVERLGEYHQSSASAPSLVGYRFDVAINSLADDDLSLITPPTVGLAAGSTAPTDISSTHNSGTLVFNDGEWRYGSPNGWGVSNAILGNLNTLFANGPTTVTVQGNTYTLDTNGAANDQAFLPPVTPTLTMSGGTWSGGKYVIDVSQALTITTSNWAGFHTAGIGGLINIDVDGVADSEVVLSRLAPASFTGNLETDTNVTSATFIIPANTLTVGDHEGYASFHRMVSQDTSQASVFAVAWWGNETSFTISAVSAIPEPSTYAAMAGALALGLAAWHRRRRQATA